jgi:hypothetical protein
MKIIISTIKLLIINLLILIYSDSNAQCTWQTEISDGYEYTSTVPGLIPGKAVHSTPQSWAVYSGNTSLYLNFVTCTPPTGACAGDLVYERRIKACPFQTYRFSAWMTTSFSGTQCDVRIKISDNLGNVLNDQPSIAAPYAPSWIQYQSTEVTPLSDTIIFSLYTNTPGVQSGNDMSFDDFLMEKCFSPYTSTNASVACPFGPTTNLHSNVPFQNSIAGTWSGPSVLTGGYLGTFDATINSIGAYTYTNLPYGSACPTAYDTVNVTLGTITQVNLGNDTTVCSTQTVQLSAGSTAGSTYLWNNGVSGSTLLAFSPGGVPTTNTYSVIVTDSTGCMSMDTIVVNFIVCNSIGENSGTSQLNFYPNPTNGSVYVSVAENNSDMIVSDLAGKVIIRKVLNRGEQLIDISRLAPGCYLVRMFGPDGTVSTGNLIVN